MRSFCSDRKKVRGQRRKLRKLLRDIDGLTPFESESNRLYEHFHVPSGTWLNSPSTAVSVKTAFCKAWLEQCQRFIQAKPTNLSFCRVVAVLCEPLLGESQIVIFYSQEYFETFWKRNYSDQSWLPLNKGSSFTAKRGIATALTEMGYEETLLVDGKTIKSTLWFYGELDPCNLGNNTH